MFELANRLVGIFKVQDCTSSLAIDEHPEEENGITGAALKTEMAMRSGRSAADATQVVLPSFSRSQSPPFQALKYFICPDHPSFER
jgi:hypothetical protein